VEKYKLIMAKNQLIALRLTKLTLVMIRLIVRISMSKAAVKRVTMKRKKMIQK